MNEADTCRKYVTPMLQRAGWDDEPHSIAEQRTFTDGRIVVTGSTSRRRKPKRVDYLLRHTRDFPIAVVEAKPYDDPVGTGMQQAKEYAEILDLRFCYAANGKGTLEYDFTTGVAMVGPRWQRPPAFNPIASRCPPELHYSAL